MVNYDIAEEIRGAIRAIMERNGLTGQLEVHYNSGSSTCEWIGKPSPSDVIITVSTNSVETAIKQEIS